MKTIIIICVMFSMGCTGLTVKEKAIAELGIQLTYNHLEPKIKRSLSELLNHQPELKPVIANLCVGLLEMRDGKINGNKTALYFFDALMIKVENETIKKDIKTVLNCIEFGEVVLTPEQQEVIKFIVKGVAHVLRD